MKVGETIYSMLTNTCPKCHQGKVFKNRNPYVLTEMFEMHENCSHCNLKYAKEPSFYYGAMYVSYALTSGWFIVWFMLQLYVLNWDTLVFALFIVGTIILLSPLSLRWSRLIWLNFFYKYDKQYNKNKKQILTYDKHNQKSVGLGA